LPTIVMLELIEETGAAQPLAGAFHFLVASEKKRRITCEAPHYLRG